ncbi:SRPBCC family protein [Salinispira pacifica]
MIQKELRATVTIDVDAEPDRVWRALTDPQIVRQYFFGTEVDSQWRAGRPIYFRGTWEGRSYEDKGTILEVDRPRLLRYDYWSNLSGMEDLPENYITLIYELVPLNGGTRFTLTQAGAADEAARSHSESNWRMVLEAMKRVVEEGLEPGAESGS